MQWVYLGLSKSSQILVMFWMLSFPGNEAGLRATDSASSGTTEWNRPSMPLAQSNGLRVGYRDMIVNYARFSKNGSPTNNLLSTSYGGDFSRDSKRERPEIFAESDKWNLWRDNAEVQNRILGEDLKTTYIQPTTSEWLQRSAIVKLKSLTYVEIV